MFDNIEKLIIISQPILRFLVTEQIVDPIIIIFAANFKILKNETK